MATADVQPVDDDNPVVQGDSSVRVERWRVITAAAGGGQPLADATIRLHAGEGRRLLTSGEAGDATQALEAALRGALHKLSGTDRAVSPGIQGRLRSECGLPIRPLADEGVLHLTVSATHANAMLSRLAALTSAHDVTVFHYEAAADGRTAHVELQVCGGVRQATRLASRLRRVVGVVDVTVG